MKSGRTNAVMMIYFARRFYGLNMAGGKGAFSDDMIRISLLALAGVVFIPEILVLS